MLTPPKVDALFDPPRLMASEATLDAPSATTTPDAEPQQGASTAHTTPAPTADSDVLPDPSRGSPDSHPTATKPASGQAETDQDAGNPSSSAAAMDPQTPDLSAGTHNDASPNPAGSPTLNGPEDDATVGSPVANGAETSASHTAMMESQTPELVAGSQGDASSTTASGSPANDASSDTQSENASASPSGTSAGISLISDVWSHAPLALSLLLSTFLW